MSPGLGWSRDIVLTDHFRMAEIFTPLKICGSMNEKFQINENMLKDKLTEIQENGDERNRDTKKGRRPHDQGGRHVDI